MKKDETNPPLTEAAPSANPPAQPTAVFSFDVFDTCITRMHAYPRDVFFDVGLRLCTHLEDEAGRIRFARRFQRARVRAEKIANFRARPHSDHADIDAIYRQLRWLMRLEQPIEELIAIELAVEEETIYPIAEILDHIQSLREAGHRIIFISDMYIPGKLLGPMLARKGVMLQGDALYVSCDFGKTKHRGGLYQHVLQTEGIAGSDVHHTGDNAHADIRMAIAHGMQTRHYTRAHLNDREVAVAGEGLVRDPARSWQAAFSRRNRLTVLPVMDEPDAHPLDDLALTIVIPFLLSYLTWIFESAREKGIGRLYFVARDGEILFKMACALKPKDLEVRYLYGSRRAWLAPSISSERPEWRRLLTVSGNASAPVDIATRAGVAKPEHQQLRELLGMTEAEWTRGLSLDEANGFVEKIVATKDAFALLYKNSLEKAATALAYFRQEGLLAGKPWALVDAGWSLNSQASLKRILEKSTEAQVAVQGYYVGLARDHFSEAEAGKAFAFVQPAGSLLSRRRVIIEHCFLPSTHASTRDYVEDQGSVEPVFSPEARTEPDLAYARRLHDLADKVAKTIVESPSLTTEIRRHTPSIQTITADFIQHPPKEEARLMSEFVVLPDMRQEREFAQLLCARLSVRDVWTTLAMTISKRAAFKQPAWMWLEGSIALSPFIVKIPLKLMLKADSWKNALRSRIQRLE